MGWRGGSERRVQDFKNPRERLCHRGNGEFGSGSIKKWKSGRREEFTPRPSRGRRRSQRSERPDRDGVNAVRRGTQGPRATPACGAAAKK
jgi:hypothetical protein